MAILSLAWKSLLNRHFTVALTVVSIALSTALLVGVERIRTETHSSFANTLSGTDLIIGARGGQVQLLLYSVFRIGNATNNLSWKSYQEIASHRKVAWTVPLSLGDSHRGYRVLGTNGDYLTYYRYGNKRSLTLTEGAWFSDLYDVVLGAEVAEQLGYQLGDEIIVAHGASDVRFSRHEDKPFRVSGILQRTGTPVDRTLHVSLQGIEAVHVDWKGGAPIRGRTTSMEQTRQMALQPKQITAALVGLKSKISTFKLQREINEYRKEPLTAILPGVALSELWGLLSVAENALLVVTVFVVVVGLFGMLSVLLTSLNERRREIAILRSVGARPAHVFILILGESSALTLLGIGFGVALLYLLLFIAQPLIEAHYGIYLALSGLSNHEWQLLGAVACAGLLVGILPSYRAYRLSLSDGLSMRT